MATINRTVYNPKLCEPYSVTVECGNMSSDFRWKDRAKVGDWMMAIWKSQEDGLFNTYSPVYVFYNIDWDSDHILYAKYERID